MQRIPCPTQLFQSERSEVVLAQIVGTALGRAHGAPLLKALAAIHRSPLRRAEWNGRFFSALRAVRFRFRPHGTAPAATLGSLRLAGFATFWFVLKALVGEKHLLAGGKYELSTTLGTLQDLIVIFHEPLSP
jgi:hypothetical protein